jgi:3-oxoacyl-[acyl-carrier protein] reductase
MSGVAVITGASRGIGKATALAFAREGYDIVCTARSTTDAPGKLPGTIEQTAEQVRALGMRALGVQCDISRDEDVAALAERALAEFGTVDVLVNNAAVNAKAPFAEMPVARWDLVLNVNLRGTMLVTKAFLPAMLEQGIGRIINVSSGAVVMPEASAKLGLIAYAASKAAIESMTASLAEELRPRSIPVNCLRIEMAVATEGALLVDPDGDRTGWGTPEQCAGSILRIARWPLTETGRVATVAEALESRTT